MSVFPMRVLESKSIFTPWCNRGGGDGQILNKQTQKSVQMLAPPLRLFACLKRGREAAIGLHHQSSLLRNFRVSKQVQGQFCVQAKQTCWSNMEGGWLGLVTILHMPGNARYQGFPTTITCQSPTANPGPCQPSHTKTLP